MEPRCVLDFYVHESAQRRGIGGALFDHFLRHENKNPARLAYDRPSEKLFAFLAKNFSLTKYQPQTNNFVVFDAYFAVKPRPASAAKELRKLTQGRGVGLAAAARAKAAAARAARREAEKEKTQTPFTRDAVSTTHGTARMYGRPPSHTSAARRGVGSVGTSSIPIVPDQSHSVEPGRAETFRASSETPNREIARDSNRRFAERRDSERETRRRARDAETAETAGAETTSQTTSRGSSPSLYSSENLIIGDRAYGATLSPPAPRRVPRPPRRATPPGITKRLVTNGDSPNDASDVFSRNSRHRASLDSGVGGESKRSFSSRGEVSVTSSSRGSSGDLKTRSETLKRGETFRRDRPNPNPPSLRGNSYASFVRGVREMGREGARGVVANPPASSRAGFGDAASDGGGVVPLEDTSPIRRGEYGQWRAPKEGYYRARAFVKTRRAPTYHYASTQAPFLSSVAGVARRPDQTGRFADAPTEPPSFALRRLSVRRGPGPRDEDHRYPASLNDARSRSVVHDDYSYAAQQNVFLARRAAFERAEAQARGDVRFGDFRIPENDEDARSARFRRDSEARARGAGYRLGPLYGERRDYGADALTRRARQSDAPRAEPELVRVGRRAMGETS